MIKNDYSVNNIIVMSKNDSSVNNIIGNDPQSSFSPLTEVADVRSLVICESNEVVVGLQPSVECLVKNQFDTWHNFKF